MAKWKDIRKELLKDPEVKKVYDELESEYRLAHSLIEARLAKKMTQAQLAKKSGVSQVMIARLESGTSNPTVGTVGRVAGVLGKELKLVGSDH
ncbi:MAG TPA: helix-turn-helix transcriptional regulator [Candidatus Limnocylindria bacterium]|nr:helix-turn-helix transcriptional regulator [Candidatus Limnocylindria bacterium]